MDLHYCISAFHQLLSVHWSHLNLNKYWTSAVWIRLQRRFTCGLSDIVSSALGSPERHMRIGWKTEVSHTSVWPSRRQGTHTKLHISECVCVCHTDKKLQPGTWVFNYCCKPSWERSSEPALGGSEPLNCTKLYYIQWIFIFKKNFCWSGFEQYIFR